MNYRIVNLNTYHASDPEGNILIIYTGGTVGMISDEMGALVSFNFKNIIDKIPSLRELNLLLTVISFPQPIDSSDVNASHWKDLGYIIYENYNQYDGFVVLHGTDTMAYSASALSFILEGLNKPVIFTGAQLPIGALRSDARENLITSLEIASAKDAYGQPVISEVCIYFNNFLLRGNRAKKVESIHFDAFESENYPPLAEAGVEIDYNTAAISPFDPDKELVFNSEVDTNVAILKLFPAITENVVRSILNIPGLKGIVLETFGSGNAPSASWFLNCIREAVSKNIIILNVSQCMGGRVIQGRYETSKAFPKLGVLSGSDLTTEAAITKLMHCLGRESSLEAAKNRLITPIAGEMS